MSATHRRKQTESDSWRMRPANRFEKHGTRSHFWRDPFRSQFPVPVASYVKRQRAKVDVVPIPERRKPRRTPVQVVRAFVRSLRVDAVDRRPWSRLHRVSLREFHKAERYAVRSYA